VPRIVGGTAGGRRIGVPPGRGTRPTSDRTREALFSALESLVDLDGAHVLDLYAGSGAVGLEAASRGAAHTFLVESDRGALAVLRRNVADLGLPGVVAATGAVERFAAAPPPPSAVPPFHVVFADPPYAVTAAALTAVLADLAANGWLADDAVVVVERSSRDAEWVWPTPLVAIRARRYGEATLWYGRAS
jgi:16S rRNA (guanine966-N2)-methyltransferase